MNKSLEITPLETWVKTGLGLSPKDWLTDDALERYQRERLDWVIKYARTNSPFYREHLKDVPDDFMSRSGWPGSVPFTTEADLRERHLDMLCVSHSEVARVITLQTSGSTAAPKRLYFTDQDLESTVDFFHYGMRTLARPGARIMVFLPGPTPGSIGDLLKKALPRMDSEAFVHGPVFDQDRAIDDLLAHQADGVVGLPVQMLGLARHPRGRDIPSGRIKSALLTADFVPRVIVEELEERWKIPIFEHYGMTEMGYGGGVQCSARSGYHLRELDLYFEVIDPASGMPAADGELGEVVFTTLNRQGVPLIRYRTGDLARFIKSPCPCGSALKRLGEVTGRLAGRVKLEGGDSLYLPEMDEVMFAAPGLLNYQAELISLEEGEFLKVLVQAAPGCGSEVLAEAERRLKTIPVIEKAVSQGRLIIEPAVSGPGQVPAGSSVKRILLDNRLEKKP